MNNFYVCIPKNKLAEIIKESCPPIPYTRKNGCFGTGEDCIKCWEDWIRTVEAMPEYIATRAPSVAGTRFVLGKWNVSGGLLECQYCGEIYSAIGANEGKAWNYCPCCGKRMDGE